MRRGSLFLILIVTFGCNGTRSNVTVEINPYELEKSKITITATMAQKENPSGHIREVQG